MINMLVIFYTFLFLFALIGSMRGWAREILVVLSVILAMAFIVIVENFLPFLRELLLKDKEMDLWFRLLTVVVLVLFGYQTPKIARIAKAIEKKDRIQDFILGLVMGLISGYFVIGTLWYFLDQANYDPIAKYIIAPKDTPDGDSILRIIKYLPPAFLMNKVTTTFIVVVIAFIFVIVVFV
jgi:uncharacterized membrane protein required for colicin V production